MKLRPSTLVAALITIALASLAVGFGAAAADAPGTAPEGRAAGFVLQVRIPGLAPITHAPVISRGGSATASGGFATQPDPSIASVITSDSTTNVAVTADAARGDSTTRAAGVTLLDGLITATTVTSQAAAGAITTAEAQSGLQSTVEGLVVAGQPIVATPNLIVPIAGIGDLVVEEEVNAVSGPQAARTFAIALHLRVRQEYRGLPAGTEILVGYADAGAAVPDPTSLTSAIPSIDLAPAVTAPIAIGSGSNSEDPPPGGFTTHPPITAEHQQELLQGGFMFPVLGATSNDFSNDFGNFRADTGFHQGIDIFAAAGTPILAINDGVVSSVGWNTLGGRRFWLTDRWGNEYYFAHLSGFSPLAKEGQQVKRGDVIGFVGNSGDARTTPPHLHFEMHPGGSWAVPPYAYVMTWLTGVQQPVDPPSTTVPDPGTTTAATTTAAKPKPKPKPLAPIETLPITTTTPPPATTAPVAPAPATPAAPPATTAPATTDTTTGTTTGGTTTDAITGTGTAFGG